MSAASTPEGRGRDVIAIILAVGIAAALNLIVIGVLYDAIINPGDAGISENATQILTGWGGGIVGILGAVFGYQAGSGQLNRQPAEEATERVEVEPILASREDEEPEETGLGEPE